jgi:hypothetical protein
MNYRLYMPVRFNHTALSDVVVALKPYWDHLTVVDCTSGKQLMLPGPISVVSAPEYNDNISKLINWCFDEVISQNLDNFFICCSDLIVAPGVVEDMVEHPSDIYAKRGWLLRIKTDVVKKVRYDERFWFYCSDTDWRRRCVDAGYTIKEDCGWDQIPSQNLLSDATNVVRIGHCCPFADQKCGVLHIGEKRHVQTWTYLSRPERRIFRWRKRADYALYKQKWGAL